MCFHRYMPDIDLSRLPTGVRMWTALVEWAAASDDRQERYFLELKSDVDLRAKEGRHKVAKFILGAANRDPAKAAKRFGGHAVMLLGVGKGKAAGIAPFEAQDLEREILKIIGASGPGWDFERIPVDGGDDVIAIIVNPPTGRIYPSLSDGAGLFNGDVYLRGDGRTEKASGAELQAMLARVAASGAASTLPDISVTMLGTAMVVRFDPDWLSRWVEATAMVYLHDFERASRAPGPFLARSLVDDRRSEAEFRGDVERWRANASADPASGLFELASKFAGGVQLRIRNPVKTPLRDVRVDVEFDAPVRALYWAERHKAHERPELFPDRPLEFGKANMFSISGISNIVSRTPLAPTGQLVIDTTSPATLSLELALLRPEATHLSDDSDVVLVLFVDAGYAGPVTGRWRLTAGDVHDVLKGELTIDAEERDWTKGIAHRLGDCDDDPVADG